MEVSTAVPLKKWSLLARCIYVWQAVRNECLLFFLSKLLIAIISKCTHIMGTNVSKFILYFHKISSIFSTLFPPLRETFYEYVGRVKSLMKCQSASFVGGGGNRINVGWCWIKIIGRMTSWLIFLFDRILRICRFGSFNVCTYHTVSIVAALFRHVCLRSTAQWNWRQNFSDFEPVTFLSFLRKHKGITFYRIFSNMSFLSSVIYSYIFTNSCTISQFLIFILLHNSAHIPFTTAMFYFHYSKSAIFRINAHRKHLLLLLAACVCPWI